MTHKFDVIWLLPESISPNCITYLTNNHLLPDQLVLNKTYRECITHISYTKLVPEPSIREYYGWESLDKLAEDLPKAKMVIFVKRIMTPLEADCGLADYEISHNELAEARFYNLLTINRIERFILYDYEADWSVDCLNFIQGVPILILYCWPDTNIVKSLCQGKYQYLQIYHPPADRTYMSMLMYSSSVREFMCQINTQILILNDDIPTNYAPSARIIYTGKCNAEKFDNPCKIIDLFLILAEHTDNEHELELMYRLLQVDNICDQIHYYFVYSTKFFRDIERFQHIFMNLDKRFPTINDLLMRISQKLRFAQVQFKTGADSIHSTLTYIVSYLKKNKLITKLPECYQPISNFAELISSRIFDFQDETVCLSKLEEWQVCVGTKYDKSGVIKRGTLDIHRYNCLILDELPSVLQSIQLDGLSRLIFSQTNQIVIYILISLEQSKYDAVWEESNSDDVWKESNSDDVWKESNSDDVWEITYRVYLQLRQLQPFLNISSSEYNWLIDQYATIKMFRKNM